MLNSGKMTSFGYKTPRAGGGMTTRNRHHHQRDASASSLQRALRTLSPQSSPVPQTPKQKNNNGHGMNSNGKNQSFKSAAPTPRNERRSSGGNSSEENVRVAIRMRPLATPSGGQFTGRAWRASTERNSIAEIPNNKSDKYTTPGKRRSSAGGTEYNYDKVFGEDTNTCDIYEDLVSDMVESATKDGINGTVFTYGQTSSGKTFTMQGCSESDNTVGIIQLAAKEIFQSIKEERSDNSNTTTSVRVSYVEIYNEELRDLLTDNNRRSAPTSLTIREDKKGSITVEGLKEVAVNSLEQLMQVFTVGEANKSVGSTKMNDRSSRSHAILKIILERTTTLNTSDDDATAEDKENSSVVSNNTSNLVVKTTSALNLVDLAGSESVRHTGASGMQKKEGGIINQSLLTLSKVLMSLGQKNPGHINYRDSKLTRMLKPSLSGNARMAVICCISPSDKYIEETRSTLQFATRAKLVKTNAVANEEVGNDDLVAKLRLESVKSKMENKRLENRLREMAEVNSNALSTQRELDNLRTYIFNDLGMPPSSDEIKDEESTDSLNALRTVLEVKAKRMKELEARLNEKESASTKAKSEARSPDSERRISRINELRSPDNDRRLSLMNEMRSPGNSIRSPKPQCQDNEYQAQNEELESKLANANALVAGFERQIDDLTSQKNDALDWIEELFSKSDQKDEKMKQACEARDTAVRRCEDLDNELMKDKELLRSVTTDKDLLASKNVQLKFDVEEASVKIASMETEIDSLKTGMDSLSESADKVEELYLEIAAAKEKYESTHESLCGVRKENWQLLQAQSDASDKITKLEADVAHLISERDELSATVTQFLDDEKATASELEDSNKVLKSRVKELEDFTSEYGEEKKALVDQIENYEDDLSHADVLFKAKSSELDDAMFSLEGEKTKWLTEKNSLLEKLKSTSDQSSSSEMELKSACSEIDALKEEQDRLVADHNQLKGKCDELSIQLSEAKQHLDDAKQYQETCANQEIILKEENDTLKTEQSRLSEKINKCQLNEHDLTNELTETRKKLDEAVKLSESRQELLNAKGGEAATYCGEIEVLRKENETAKTEQLKLTENLDEYQLRVSELLRELSGADAKLDEAKALKAKLGGLEEENERLAAEKESLSADCDGLQQEMKNLMGKVKDAQQQIEEAEKDKSIFDEVRKEKNRLSIAELHLTENNNECNRRADSLSRDLAEVRKQLDGAKQYEATAKKMKLENERLTAEHAVLAEGNNELRLKVDGLSTKLAEALVQLEDVKAFEEGMFDSLQEDNSKLTSENLSLNDKYIESLDKVDALTKEVLAARQSLDVANTVSINALKQENEHLTTETKYYIKKSRDDRASVEALKQENEQLASETKHYIQKVDNLSTDLAQTQKQLEDAKSAEAKPSGQQVDSLKSENLRLRNERRHLAEDYDKCCKQIEELSSELLCMEQRLRDAMKLAVDGENADAELIKLKQEKSQLLNDLHAANAKVKQQHGELQNAKRELSTAQNAKDEVKKSVPKIQQLVEALSSENANLKEKNEGFERAREYLENRSRELQGLLATATNERDMANKERNNLKETNTNLFTKFKKLSGERDVAIREHTSVRTKLDKIAADFEADYEIIRSKTETLLVEKRGLEDKVAFLEASKASIEDNADRILERDNAMTGQYDRLKAEFKKQSLKNVELQGEVNQLVKRLAHLKDEFGRVSRDNCALTDMIQSRARSNDPANKRRDGHGFRALGL